MYAQLRVHPILRAIVRTFDFTRNGSCIPFYAQLRVHTVLRAIARTFDFTRICAYLVEPLWVLAAVIGSGSLKRPALSLPLMPRPDTAHFVHSPPRLTPRLAEVPLCTVRSVLHPVQHIFRGFLFTSCTRNCA